MLDLGLEQPQARKANVVPVQRDQHWWALAANAPIGKYPLPCCLSPGFYLFLRLLGQQHVHLGRESIKACQNKWLQFAKISPTTLGSIILKLLPVEVWALLSPSDPSGWEDLQNRQRLSHLPPTDGLMNPYRVCGKYANTTIHLFHIGGRRGEVITYNLVLVYPLHHKN